MKRTHATITTGLAFGAGMVIGVFAAGIALAQPASAQQVQGAKAQTLFNCDTHNAFLTGLAAVERGEELTGERKQLIQEECARYGVTGDPQDLVEDPRHHLELETVAHNGVRVITFRAELESGTTWVALGLNPEHYGKGPWGSETFSGSGAEGEVH